MEYLPLIILISLPLYAWPFRFLGIPTNPLMLILGVVWVIFIAFGIRQKKVASFVASIGRTPIPVLVSIALFTLAGLVSTIMFDITREKIGQFLVLFIQPIGTFFLLRFIFAEWKQSVVHLRSALYWFVGLLGIFAIVQYTTRFGLPMLYWGNDVEPKRALSVFMHPNFYAMFVTPLLAFVIPDVSERIRNQRLKVQTWLLVASWLVGALGLLLSLSRGGWLGFAAAILTFVLMQSSRWVWWHGLVIVVAALNIAWAVPAIRNRAVAPFLGERSANSRFALWKTGWHMIEDNPVFGKGITGFTQNWQQYTVDRTLDMHPTPHNIYLHTWVEYGILGVGSFLSLLFLGLRQGLRNRKNVLVLGAGLALVAIMVHGFVDTPYCKNDLAVLFWIVYALLWI